MYETVTVQKILDAGTVEVRCGSNACAGCKAGMFCTSKNKSFEANNTNHLALEEGMRVELFLKPSRTIASTIITLILPLFLFPVGYYFSTLLGTGDGASTLWGLGGIVVGFLLVARYFRKTKGSYLPQVDRIVENDEPAERQ